jgi:hypothetical protein
VPCRGRPVRDYKHQLEGYCDTKRRLPLLRARRRVGPLGLPVGRDEYRRGTLSRSDKSGASAAWLRTMCMTERLHVTPASHPRPHPSIAVAGIPQRSTSGRRHVAWPAYPMSRLLSRSLRRQRSVPCPPRTSACLYSGRMQPYLLAKT